MADNQSKRSFLSTNWLSIAAVTLMLAACISAGLAIWGAVATN